MFSGIYADAADRTVAAKAPNSSSADARPGFGFENVITRQARLTPMAPRFPAWPQTLSHGDLGLQAASALNS